MAEPDPPDPRTCCADKDCPARTPNHQWGRIRATGWFEERDGTMWCPDHRPAWYAAWRARQQTTVSPTE